MGVRRDVAGLRMVGFLVALVAGLAGCFEPYRAHVDPDVLAKSGWLETVHPLVDDGEFFGTKQQQTDYDAPEGVPPGHLEVYSIRSGSSPGVEVLLNRSRQEITDYAQRVGLELDPRYDVEGSRTWDSGLRTRWVAMEGRATGSGLFAQDYKVRLIAEVAHDGRSSTSVVALGAAQVETARQCPIIGACPRQADERTWSAMVGDPERTVRGAYSTAGLLDNLVTQ